MYAFDEVRLSLRPGRFPGAACLPLWQAASCHHALEKRDCANIREEALFLRRIMPPPGIFHQREHFAQRARERGFSLENAIACVSFPDKKLRQGKGEEGGFKEVFEKTFGERKLFIVAEVKSLECWLITGYWQP